MFIKALFSNIDQFQPIDQAPLRHSDVLILSCLTQTPLTNPDSMIGEFCVNAGKKILEAQLFCSELPRQIRAACLIHYENMPIHRFLKL